MKTKSVGTINLVTCMNKKLTIWAVCTFCLLFIGNLEAQIEEKVSFSDSTSANKTFKHALNTCPAALAFGIYSINYEYRFSEHHGLVGRFDYEAIPKTYTDAAIESSGVAYILNYRWHLSGAMKSTFLGAYTRYRVYDGNGSIASTDFDFKIPETTFGLNVGKRWVWRSGFNLTLAFGYGFSVENRESDPTNNAIESSLNAYEKEYDFIDPFLGEFSIGYAF